MSHILENFVHQLPFIIEGTVLDTADPMQMGRLKIWCPSVDTDDYVVDNLPWAEYASPIGGTTTDFPAGRNNAVSNGPVSFGFWAIPKIGTQVLVFFLNGDQSRRFYFASYFGLHRNRSIPAGRNISEKDNTYGPWTDTYDSLEPARSNLIEQFQGKLNAPQAVTRGVYERQAAQAKTDKDGSEGYRPSGVNQAALDPQTYCFTTPGHHALIMTDDPQNCRVRIKTAEGNQIIFDDTNERIYVSTARGKTWVELDEDGHINIFAADSISVRSAKDINMYADRDINLEAQRNINLTAVTGDYKLTVGNSIHLNATGSIYETCCGQMHVTGGSNFIVTAGRIDLNGPVATCATVAERVPIVTGHEPWPRPATSITRNKNWKT